MAIAKQKIVQAFIQGAIEVVGLVQEADAKLDDFLTRLDAHGIDLTDTNITAAELSAARTFKTTLNDLATGQVATTIKSKDHPSHGTGALG